MSSTRHSSVSEAENLSSSNNACNRTTSINNPAACNNSKDQLSNEQTSSVKQELPKQHGLQNDTKKNVPFMPQFQAFCEQKFVQPFPTAYGPQFFFERPVPIFNDYVEAFKSKQASNLPCNASEYVSIRYLAPLNMVKGEAPNRMAPGLITRPVENPSIRSVITPIEPIFVPNIPPPYHYGSRGQLYELNNISVDPKSFSSRPVSQYWNMTGGAAAETGDGVNEQNDKNFYNTNSIRMSPQTRFLKMLGLSDTNSDSLTFSKFASIAVCISFIIAVIVIGSIMGSFFAYSNEGIYTIPRNSVGGIDQNATDTIGNSTFNVEFSNTTRTTTVPVGPRIIIGKKISDDLKQTPIIAPTTIASTTVSKITAGTTTIFNENSTVELQNESSYVQDVTTTTTTPTTTKTTPIASSSISFVSITSSPTIKPIYSRAFANKGRYNFNSMLTRGSSSISLNTGNL